MAQIELTEDTVTIHLQGIDRLVALGDRFEIPLDTLVSVEAKGRNAPRKGLWALASRLPAAVPLPFGTFHAQHGRGLWEMPDPGRTLEISMLGGRYSRLVLEVEDPIETAQTIQRACTN